MDFKSIVRKIEEGDDEISVIVTYSLIISNLQQLYDNISFPPMPENKVLNMVNDNIIAEFRSVLLDNIEYFKNMIKIHIDRKKNNNVQLVNNTANKNNLSFRFTK